MLIGVEIIGMILILLGAVSVFAVIIVDFWKDFHFSSRLTKLSEKSKQFLWTARMKRFYKKYGINNRVDGTFDGTFSESVHIHLWWNHFRKTVPRFTKQYCNHVKQMFPNGKVPPRRETRTAVRWYYNLFVLTVADMNKKCRTLNVKTTVWGNKMFPQAEHSSTHWGNICCDIHNMRLLTISEIFTLIKNNISAEKYFTMLSEGHTVANIITWGNMPNEWVKKLELTR